MIENVHFTITPPARGNSSSSDRPGISNFGQIEIFYKAPAEIFTAKLSDSSDKKNNKTTDDFSADMLNEHQAYCRYLNDFRLFLL